MEFKTALLAGIGLFVGLSSLQDSPRESQMELKASEYQSLVQAVATSRGFVSAASLGHSSTVQKLCSSKWDPVVPQVGDGPADDRFRIPSGKDLKSIWGPLKAKFYSVECVRMKSGLYFWVWMRPTGVKWDGDVALVVKASSGKIVGIEDASE